MMQDLKELEKAFRMEGHRLDGMILTTYTSFDHNRLAECIKIAGVSQTLDANKVWLFQCNPSRKDTGKARFARRLFRPACQLSGNPLTCAQCLGRIRQGSVPLKCFHPKVWLLRFAADDGAVVWRMVVSSKNFSGGSWKLMDCYYMTETTQNAGGYKADLRGFLEGLRTPEKAPEDPAWDGFAAELDRAKWKDPFVFWQQNGGSVSAPWQGQENLGVLYVLSPFVRDDFRSQVASSAVFDAVHVYSYAHQIEGLDAGKWTAEDTFHAPPSAAEEEAEPLHFHAKIYIWKMRAQWYMCIGSPNATASAFTRNSEAAVWFAIDGEEKKQILEAWERWFPCSMSPKGSGFANEGETEAAGSQFAEATGDDVQPVALNVDEKQAMSAEMLREMRETAFAKLSGSQKRSYWMHLMLGAETAEGLKAKIRAVETTYPELVADEVWCAYRDSCISTRDAVSGDNKGEEE